MPQEKRSYHSPKREEQARETRRKLLESARRLLRDKGWGGTTLKAVAADAGVAEPTVYAVFGTKAGLAMALVDLVDESADVDALVAVIGDPTGAPIDQLLAIARFEARMAEQAGDVIRILRDASEPELFAAYRNGEERGRAGFRRLIESWPAGTLRAGLELDEAVDIFSAIFTMEPYDVLVRLGWSTERIVKYWHRALAAEVLELR